MARQREHGGRRRDVYGRAGRQGQHAGRRPIRRRGAGTRAIALTLTALVAVVALVAAFLLVPDLRRMIGFGGSGDDAASTSSNPSSDRSSQADGDVSRGTAPSPTDPALTKARRLVADMSLEEQVGQLVMAPLFAGDDASVLKTAIADRHVGSVLIIGNWRNGVTGVRKATDALQSYAPDGNRLIMATDQEGGLVQHLKGTGFDTMPSAVQQGTMSTDALRQSAARWGTQLGEAGINVDLAPVLGTVTIERKSNAPVGALDRDFGLDAAGNAAHGAAFVEGMRDAGVQSSIKHYPGLGAVQGNTDFTANGITDTTTTADGTQIGAFHTVLDQAKPAMVMMSLATYQRIDPNNPAAFSPTIVDGLLRGTHGFDGVVTSDSLSAEAVGHIPTDQLGVKFIEAGGDLACIGQSADIEPILNGLNARANSDPAFAQKVTESATRVMRLKVQMGLA
ncbi:MULTISPECIES: glycoside hydrolase family 3 N-terminal domain-containing protein [unclassified Bifidobacterium]|uniref:glycoside hydrolase family 3 N-terminal domain-containing protein n=1 Tax=unclassified Bifidobacterium TaxID=2608897 RepID=UPI0021597376|nr:MULTISPECIES: glycoside hydrolase family 3 N-terminal domain-containing protein [unclassified Bifidobacterium]